MSAAPMLPEAALQQHVAVLGKTRSGKSSVMRRLVEGLLERKLPVCIVDPKGDWWGIKLAKDGKRAGYPVVIFGGEHADVPINAHAGAQVAEIFATGNRPCLIDLGGWMVGERTRFWIDFASTLFKLTKGMRWLVVDEVHNFAPKGKVMDPDSGKALHWTNRLASEGLGKGLPMIFASQRPQKVHNDTLTSAETLIAMRVLHPSDRAAVSEWVKGCGDVELGAQVLNSLAQMDRGEGWVWSPEIGFGPKRVKFPLFNTYDSFRPQTAEDAKSLKGWAEVDLDEIKAKFASAVKEAEDNDPKLLRKRIAELERQLATRSSGAAGVPEQEVQQRIAAAVVAEREASKRELEKLTVPLAKIRDVVMDALGVGFAAMAREAAPTPRPQANRTNAPVEKHPVQFSKFRNLENPSLSKAERLILTALAQHPNGCTKAKVAILTGYAVNGGGFNNAISSARTKGFLTGGTAGLQITHVGIEALGSFDPLPTGPALLQHWLAQLGKAERSALEQLAAAYPATLSKADLATRAGYEASGGGFNNALSRLRTLELIEGRGELRASTDLF